MNRAALTPISGLLVALAVSACTTGWQRRPLEEPAAPDAFAGETVAGQSTVDSGWFEAFGSATLDQAVTTARASNLSLAQAGDRVRQAAAMTRLARSGQLPSIDAGASAGRSRQMGPTGPAQANAFQLSLSAAYEVDLWGRISAGRGAAVLDAAALATDVATIEITVTANVVEAWLDGVHARARRELLLQQIEVQEGYVDLLIHRMSIAAATALDVEQQRQQVAALRAQFALLEAAEDTAGHRISVLQGLFPDPAATGDESELPALPPLPDVGVPADLLERRPDVEAARLRAESADARLAVAIADRLPSLRLSGSAFFQATSLSNLFDQLLWSVTAGLVAPLFDGGRRGAEVERNRAVVDERIHAYLGTLLTAAIEVENALTLEQAQTAFLTEIDAQLEIATDTLLLARDQYREGVSDYLRVLTAISTLQQLEQSRLDAVRQQLAYRIQLYRALGGGWSRPEST